MPSKLNVCTEETDWGRVAQHAGIGWHNEFAHRQKNACALQHNTCFVCHDDIILAGIGDPCGIKGEGRDPWPRQWPRRRSKPLVSQNRRGSPRSPRGRSGHHRGTVRPTGMGNDLRWRGRFREAGVDRLKDCLRQASRARGRGESWFHPRASETGFGGLNASVENKGALRPKFPRTRRESQCRCLNIH